MNRSALQLVNHFLFCSISLPELATNCVNLCPKKYLNAPNKPNLQKRITDNWLLLTENCTNEANFENQKQRPKSFFAKQSQFPIL
jgi:hypothetical protein